MFRKIQVVLLFVILNVFVSSHAAAQTYTYVATKLSGGSLPTVAPPAGFYDFHIGWSWRPLADGSYTPSMSICLGDKFYFLLTSANGFIPLTFNIYTGYGAVLNGDTDVRIWTAYRDIWWTVDPGVTWTCNTVELHEILSGGGRYIAMHGGGGDDVLMAPMPSRLYGDSGADTLLNPAGAPPGQSQSLKSGGSGNDTLVANFSESCDGGTGTDKCPLTPGCATRVSCETTK
jgi:hypothetical protein